MIPTTRPSRKRRASRVLALLVLPVLLAAAPREQRIFLTHGAPEGLPGARHAFEPVCGDTSWRDTLYLAFEPASDESTFFGYSGELLVYAQPGDTLGTFWGMEHGGPNNGGLVMQFGPDESFPQPQPWGAVGIGSVVYDRTPSSARFRFFYGMPQSGLRPVTAGTRYVVGRLVLGAKHTGLTGCDRPVCIEWHSATLSYARARNVPVTHGGSRWLERGAAADCSERIPAWRPRAVPQPQSTGDRAH